VTDQICVGHVLLPTRGFLLKSCVALLHVDCQYCHLSAFKFRRCDCTLVLCDLQTGLVLFILPTGMLGGMAELSIKRPPLFGD